MRTLHLPSDIYTVAVTDPIPLLDDEFDRYDPLQAYGEGFAEQSSFQATAADTEE